MYLTIPMDTVGTSLSGGFQDQLPWRFMQGSGKFTEWERSPMSPSIRVSKRHHDHDRRGSWVIGFDVTRRLSAPMGGIGHTVAADRDWERIP